MDRLLSSDEIMQEGDYAIYSPNYIQISGHEIYEMPIMGLIGEPVSYLLSNLEDSWDNMCGWVAVLRPERTENHWGHWVTSNTPVTGVASNNSIAWEWIDEVVCLDCNPDIDEDGLDNWDMVECDSSHTKLIGDWTISDKDDDKTAWFKDYQDNYYTPNKGGEWCGIERESVVQVVWSIYTQRCSLCSPCYPGQGDLDSEGEFLAYTLPPSCFYQPI